MKKYTASLTGLFLVFALSLSAYADFFDVAPTHQNSTAINYLQEHGVIQGYPDKSFQPAKEVNRAEFLKIILEGSNIPLDSSEKTPFIDVNHTSWYAPYLQKAYKEGWLIGYEDKTARPGQTITKVEALKLLGAVQKWQLAEEITQKPFDDIVTFTWYAPYVSYAKTHGFLEETEHLYHPHYPMTRAQISEVIYRTMIGDTAPIEQPKTEQPQTEPPKTTPENTVIKEETNFTPVSFTPVPSGYFSNITLNEALPNTFYKNEVYQVAGEISSGSYSTITVALQKNNKTEQVFQQKVVDKKFNVPIHFRTAGNYSLGIFPGSQGQSKALPISILSALPENATAAEATAATTLHVNYGGDQTWLSHNSPINTLKKTVVSQGNASITYYSRQDLSTIPIQYNDFEKFSEGKVSVTLATAPLSSQAPLSPIKSFSETLTTSFTAVEHSFEHHDTDEVATNITTALSSVKEIKFSGTALTDIKQKAYIQKPNGFVETKDLSTSSSTSSYYGSTLIPASGTFSFSYMPKESGRYIVEVNKKDATAAINIPVYVGNVYPLIPDYFDLHTRSYFEGSFDENALRAELLELLNQSRKAHGLSAVTLSPELNTLAQGHSNDMAKNNFFGHINQKNESPNDRRLKLGITTPVSENLAKDVSIGFAHFGLMRSPAHRENILTPEWERVGLGVAEDDGYLIITQEFATNPLDEGSLATFEEELFQSINELRKKNGANPLVKTEALASATEYLNQKIVVEKVALTSELFKSTLNTYSISGISQAIGRLYHIWSEIANSILQDEKSTLIDSSWKNIGIDIKLDSTGSLNTILILNK